jgi:hypothetical protein
MIRENGTIPELWSEGIRERGLCESIGRIGPNLYDQQSSTDFPGTHSGKSVAATRLLLFET